jgi:hypothetical protein
MSHACRTGAVFWRIVNACGVVRLLMSYVTLARDIRIKVIGRVTRTRTVERMTMACGVSRRLLDHGRCYVIDIDTVGRLFGNAIVVVGLTVSG